MRTRQYITKFIVRGILGLSFLLKLCVLACFACGEGFVLVQFCGLLNAGDLLTKHRIPHLSLSHLFFLSLGNALSFARMRS